jgi:hypothetical protein
MERQEVRVVLSLFVLWSLGCSNRASPTPQTDPVKGPTILEAKAALVDLLDHPIVHETGWAAFPGIAPILQSAKARERLQRDEVRSDEYGTYIGDWSCSLEKKRCICVLDAPGEQIRVIGEFRQKPDRSWKVVITGIEHASVAPKQ